jgi:phytoene synthase
MPELDALVRRVDEDRWLASRFADAEQRARLMALYALNYEIARIAESVREAPLADIRYAWWREALASSRADHAHPVLNAFFQRWPEPAASQTMQKILDARQASDLSPTPFPDLEAMERYAASTAGGLIAIAAKCLDGIDEALADAAGRAWGLAGLMRAAPHWAARGRVLLPDGANLCARFEAAFAQARTLARRAPARAFAAYGYVALAPAYMRGAKPALFARQVRLVLAAARGRL